MPDCGKGANKGKKAQEAARTHDFKRNSQEHRRAAAIRTSLGYKLVMLVNTQDCAQVKQVSNKRFDTGSGCGVTHWRPQPKTRSWMATTRASSDCRLARSANMQDCSRGKKEGEKRQRAAISGGGS